MSLCGDLSELKKLTKLSEDRKERCYCFGYITTIRLQANVRKYVKNVVFQKSQHVWMESFATALRFADSERGYDISHEKYNEYFDNNYDFEVMEPISIEIGKNIKFNVHFRHSITDFEHEYGYFEPFKNEFANEIIQKLINLNIINDDEEIDIFIENNPAFSYRKIIYSKADLLVHGYVSNKNLGLRNNIIIPSTLKQLCVNYFIADFPSMKTDFDRNKGFHQINKTGRKKFVDLLWSILCPQNDKILTSLCQYLFDTINKLSLSMVRGSDENYWKGSILEYFMYFVIASTDIVNFNSVLLDHSDLIKKSLDSVAAFRETEKISKLDIIYIYLGALVTYNEFYSLYQYKIRHGDWNNSWEFVDALTILRALHEPDRYGTMRNVQRIAATILCNDKQLEMVNMADICSINVIQTIATIMDDISLNSSDWNDICHYRHKIQLSLAWLFSQMQNYEINITDHNIKVYLKMIVGNIWRYIWFNPYCLPYDIFETLDHLKHYGVDITPYDITIDVFTRKLYIIFNNVSHMQVAFDVLSDALENIGGEKDQYVDLLRLYYKIAKLESELKTARMTLLKKLQKVRAN